MLVCVWLWFDVCVCGTSVIQCVSVIIDTDVCVAVCSFGLMFVSVCGTSVIRCVSVITITDVCVAVCVALV